MNKEQIILKAEEFQYPTKEEKKHAFSLLPEFHNYGFKFKNSLFLILDGKKINESAILENLHWWDNVLLNRFGSLRNAYVNVVTHYARGFPEEYQKCSKIENINRFMFDSNVEIFYYFFFVSCDVIAQILRLQLNPKIDERNVHFNDRFLKSLPEGELRNFSRIFFKNTKVARDYRNSFAHRFPPNHPDFRVSVSSENGSEILNAGAGSYAKPGEIITNINESLSHLSLFMTESKKILFKHQN